MDASTRPVTVRCYVLWSLSSAFFTRLRSTVRLLVTSCAYTQKVRRRRRKSSGNRDSHNSAGTINGYVQLRVRQRVLTCTLGALEQKRLKTSENFYYPFLFPSFFLFLIYLFIYNAKKVYQRSCPSAFHHNCSQNTHKLIFRTCISHLHFHISLVDW